MDPRERISSRRAISKFFDVEGVLSPMDTSCTARAPIYGFSIWPADTKKSFPSRCMSDFDQLREHWVKKPLEYLTASHIAPDGSSAVFTARGEVFHLPAKNGRIVKVAGNSALRGIGKRVFSLTAKASWRSRQTLVKRSSGSIQPTAWAQPEQWTKDAKVLRLNGVTSPDGHWLAYSTRTRSCGFTTSRPKLRNVSPNR